MGTVLDLHIEKLLKQDISSNCPFLIARQQQGDLMMIFKKICILKKTMLLSPLLEKT